MCLKLKLNELKKDLKAGILGLQVAFVDVIEFQKRGLPHAHMLLHLGHDSKLRTPEDIDSLISAEIPDPNEDAELYETVKSSMMHGPCGHLNPQCPCMREGNCSKNFPKSFTEATVLNNNGYPSYKRSDNGRTVRVRNVDLDNRWVVPYNPYLCKKYSAHINLEACVSIKSVKYLYKYIYKGHDQAHIEINEQLHHDEVKTYLDARYVSAPEAMWRLCAFPMHNQSHSIIRLAVHLPNHQLVYFRQGEEEIAADRALNNRTSLTAWFDLNTRDENARQYLYPDVPYHYVFHQRDKTWRPRRRDSGKILSRMYSAIVTQGERYFLRVLLLHVPGATSFEDLRTFEDVLHPTFRETCLARGLLEDDEVWTHTMEDLVLTAEPYSIRKTFAYILVHGNPSDPLALWNRFRHAMIEDFLRNMTEMQAEQAALSRIEAILRQTNDDLVTFGLPPVDEKLSF